MKYAARKKWSAIDQVQATLPMPLKLATFGALRVESAIPSHLASRAR